MLKVYRTDRDKEQILFASPPARDFSTIDPLPARGGSSLKKEEREGMKTSMTNLNSERVNNIV